MKSLPLLNDNLVGDPMSPPTRRKKKKTLHGDVIELYKEENAELQREVKLLRAQSLTHDKKEADLQRRARSATEDAEAYLEALSVLARVVSNGNRAGRAARAEARRLLESRGAKPPSTLGSSRNRPKTGPRQKTT